MEMKRGIIRDPEKYLRIKDMSGLRWGDITPGDLDCFVEFGGTLFVFMEIKYGHSNMKTGQRLGYERLCDALESAGRTSAVLVAVDRLGIDPIDVASLPVERYRFHKEWKEPQEQMTVLEVINNLKMARQIEPS